ncbi:DUF3050 domain-containing protein [Brumimicrobium aurantiacum]|uniref:DUF3050 domain-containing protein n=1 Tax=Brumimicrobium aurantiacum TaxID=1737063 RepID=A0A3E1F196_9FLAO|nr:DUF3050 domain-containing protein [Brumimicrobium aurantiacum]RFC55575.1 DUF3050 domain-containing protein [Brumimicrobium aurantiacum]
MNNLELIEQRTQDLRSQLKNHNLYRNLNAVKDVSLFMEKHVYAVWDFMSLLKALQISLTCVSLPWKPVKNEKTARFINEIVLGEESDVNEKGVPKSHYEMYLDAMDEVGADTSRISKFVEEVGDLSSVNEYLDQADLKPAEKEFLKFTFDVIQSNEIHKIAAAFTFGREDLIPDMFIAIIEKSNNEHNVDYPKLMYYLKRHIELDGDEHGPLSLEMISELCGEDQQKWDEVVQISIAALQKRVELWDEIEKELEML